MSNADTRILVVGATGALGSAIARRLLESGNQIRAFGRQRAKLDELSALGAEVVVGDLLDLDAVTRACSGVGQIITTANNVMGHGASSPHRVDLQAHRNLCAAARSHDVRRLIYVYGFGMGGLTSPVDFFRLKEQTALLIKSSGVPYVLLSPTVFMETWVGMLLGDGIRDKGTAVLFGDGKRVANFIAIRDVAEFAAKLLAREEIVNETVEVGGPSTTSFTDVVGIVERELGVTAKRRNVPTIVLRLGSALLRPFSEVTSRMMALGYFTATRDTRLDEWRESAERFGVEPITVEAFVADRFGKARATAPAS